MKAKRLCLTEYWRRTQRRNLREHRRVENDWHFILDTVFLIELELDYNSSGLGEIFSECRLIFFHFPNAQSNGEMLLSSIVCI